MADELRMVKAFHRPDAGKEEQLPSDLRPPGILKRTVRYLLDKVASPSASLAEYHKFVWDRTRCIRNDFTIQASSRLDDIKIAIECYEDIARFHILSLHQMPKIGKHDYDAQQELEQLSATLLTLFEYYDDNRGTYEAPREAEFRAYKLLIDIRSRTNDTFERVQTWPPRIRDAHQVQIAVQLCQASGNVLTDTASMLSPYSRTVRVEQAQYEKFWSILESPKVDYLMACAATVSFNEIRARTLETMAKVYRSGPQSRMQDISLEELTFALGFDSKSQTRRLFRETGLHISKHANGTSFLDLDELTGPFPKSAILTADQMFSQSIVEVKRENRALGAIYNGFNVTYCKENGLLEDSDPDGDYQPDEDDVDSEEEEESLFVDGDMDDQASKAPAISSSKIANPFSSFVPTGTIQKPLPSAFGGFGQPSRIDSIFASGGQSSDSLLASNTTTTSSAASNAFAQPKQQNGVSTSSFVFGQPSNSISNSMNTLPANNSTKPSISGLSFPTFSGLPSINTTTGMVGSKPPAPSLFSTPSTQLQQGFPTFGNPSNQVSGQTAPTSAGLNPGGTDAPRQSLPSFVFQGPSTNVAESIAPPNASAVQFSAPNFGIKVPVPAATSFSMPTFGQQAPATSISAQSSSNTSIPALFQQQKQPDGHEPQPFNATTSHPLVQKPFQSLQPISTSTPSSATTSGPAAASSSQKAAPARASMIEQQAAAAKQAEDTLQAQRALVQKRKDAALERIVKEIVLGPNGVLEQFIEAELVPIYERAQRKVTKERTQARLAEIQQNYLIGKFAHIWKWRVEEKLRSRKAMERRARMRRLQSEDNSREQSVFEKRKSIEEGSLLSQANGPLRHLNRGFQETFDSSTSDQHLVPRPNRSASRSRQEKSPKPMRSTVLATNSMTAPHAGKRIGHTRSQTVDVIPRTSLHGQASKSMPPPKRSSNRASLAVKQNPAHKSFVGTGFLQNTALRREAMDFARRSGSITTTSSDYFRLKARNIDPDTSVVSSSRKRGRGSGDSFASSLTSKSRRLSESSTSTLSLSESTRGLLARSTLSDSARSLVITQSHTDATSTTGTTTPKYTDEEDALFEAARRLRETLAEETSWMKSMREEAAKIDDSLQLETPAQRRLREFEPTPSKTSIRLRQTYANGLLSPDYFDKKEAIQHKSIDQELSNDLQVNGVSTTKIGLAALSTDQNQYASHLNVSINNGTSFEDAIEL